MKVTVVGAGAVGGYFGGRLQDAGFDVTFLVRKKRAEQLRKSGLSMRSPFGDLTIEPQLALDPQEIAECDLVILALKNYHLASAIDSIRTLVEKGAKILPLMNGVEYYQTLEEEFGKSAVLGGLCQIIVTLDEQGDIVHSNQMHDVTFGPFLEEQTEFCSEFYEKAKKANLRIFLRDNIEVDVWNKFAFITSFSGVTTASRLSIDQVFAVDAAKEVFETCLYEMKLLASSQQVQLPEVFVETVMENMRKMPAGATSSMHQDFRKELPLEVESLQGAAVRLAKQADIELPTIKTLYGLIKPFERL